MDAPMVIHMACTLVGGLGIFLLGMKNLSDGLQAVAGSGRIELPGPLAGRPALVRCGGAAQEHGAEDRGRHGGGEEHQDDKALRLHAGTPVRRSVV